MAVARGARHLERLLQRVMVFGVVPRRLHGDHFRERIPGKHLGSCALCVQRVQVRVEQPDGSVKKTVKKQLYGKTSGTTRFKCMRCCVPLCEACYRRWHTVARLSRPAEQPRDAVGPRDAVV
jgi:hypothetical protein